MPDEFPLDVDMLLRVLNYLNLGVYITDRKRRIILWNRKAEEITGHRAADVVGSACHDNILCHVNRNGQPLCSTQLCPLYRAMSVGKESEEPVLLYAQRADGSRVPVSVSVAPLLDESGKVIGGIEAFMDESHRIRDLERARRVQQHLLPQSLPQPENLRFDVRYYPHDLVGGDFYDVRALDGDRYIVFVADVGGHGLSAALYTMYLKSLVNKLIADDNDVAGFMTALNRELNGLIGDESFATGLCAVVDTSSYEVTYSIAGHPPPLHLHAADNKVSSLGTHGLPLGVIADENYDADRIRLDAGDLLLGFTDGITEVVDRGGRQLGSAALAELLLQETSGGMANLLERLYRKTVEASGNVSLGDDVLLLSIHRPSTAT